jgi:Family of unknown function (DUF6152)
MLRISLATIVVYGSLLWAGGAQAHHSVPAEFDLSKQGEISGEVTKVWFANPHIRYGFRVTKADGSTEEWELQANNITGMRRLGWDQNTLKAGDRITVFGDLGRSGAKKLRMHNIKFADGRVLAVLDDAQPSYDPDQINADTGKSYGYSDRGNRYPIDITGGWRNRYMWHRTVDDLDPKPTPFTAEGRRVFEATKPWHDPSLRCVAPALPRIFGAPYNMDIVDAGSHYLFLYVEHNTPRRIWMDGRKPSADTPATAMGYSIGRWEGGALVIETTNLLPAWLDGSGLPMSGDGTRIVERYEPSADHLSMTRTMTIHDPYYTEPLVRHRASARDDDLDLTEQASCDPDSYYRDLETSGRLDEHFGR